MYAYIDETGNTGENLFDQAQPLFMTAALVTRADFDFVQRLAVTKLARKFGEPELHANELGLGRIEQIARDLHRILKMAAARFFLSRVEKKYLATTKVVDTLFDAGENAAVPWHVYNIRVLRLIMVFKVAALLDEAIVRNFWTALMNPRREEAYRQFVAFCEELLPRVEWLPDARSREIVSQAVAWAHDNPQAIYLTASSKLARYGHLPNMVAFTNLLEGLELQSQAWARPVRKIRHDRQMQFERTLKYWHELFANASPDPLYWPGGEKHVLRKVFGSQFIVSSAAESAGIQLVDVILWLFRQVLNGEAIPYQTAKLMNFVFRRAMQNDFSFEGVSARLNETFGEIMAAPMTDEQLTKGKVLLDQFEKQRQAAMIKFAHEDAGPRAVPSLGPVPD